MVVFVIIIVKFLIMPRVLPSFLVLRTGLQRHNSRRCHLAFRKNHKIKKTTVTTWISFALPKIVSFSLMILWHNLDFTRKDNSLQPVKIKTKWFRSLSKLTPKFYENSKRSQWFHFKQAVVTIILHLWLSVISLTSTGLEEDWPSGGST